VMFGDVRRCSARFGEVRRGSARFGEVRRGSARFGEVRRCYPMLSDVQRCSAMFDDVRRYYPMFSDIIRCSAILSELQFTIVTTFYFNLESLVLPDSQVHPFYTPSSRPIFGDGGDVRRCLARLWRDLDDALKDELYRIRGRGPPPDDPPSFNSRS